MAIREVKFESEDRRIKQIIAALNENGIKNIEEANAICENMVSILIRVVKRRNLSVSKMQSGLM